MYKVLNFTEEGLRAFIMVVLSCFPVHGELNEEVRSIIKSAIKDNKQLNERGLIEGLPALVNEISKFSKNRGQAEITENSVFGFFGGKFHYQKVLRDLDEVSIVHNSVFSLKTIFAHLVLPVEIVAKSDDGFVGKYSAGGYGFSVRGLGAFSQDAEFLEKELPKRNVIVLIHYATIVKINPSTDVLNELYAQNDFKIFALACKYLKKHASMDYGRFPTRRCSADTRKMLEKILL